MTLEHTPIALNDAPDLTCDAALIGDLSPYDRWERLALYGVYLGQRPEDRAGAILAEPGEQAEQLAVRSHFLALIHDGDLDCASESIAIWRTQVCPIRPWLFTLFDHIERVISIERRFLDA